MIVALVAVSVAAILASVMVSVQVDVANVILNATTLVVQIATIWHVKELRRAPMGRKNRA